MGTSTNILFLSFAISLPAIAKSIEYQPISITVNENFNTQPSEIQQGTLSLIPNSVHQGANFYFNPQVKLPSRVLPPHILTLLTPTHKKNESIMVQKQPTIFLGGEQIIEILRPNELQPTIDRGDIEEIPLPSEELVLEEDLFFQKPPEAAIQEEIVVIPDASMLPPIPVSVISEQINDIPVPSAIENGQTIVEEIVGIPADPVPPSSINFIPNIIVEADSADIGYVNNILESPSPPSYNGNQIIIQDIVALPAAPLLPPPSINLHPAVIEEEVNTLPIPKPVEVITENKFETPARPSPVHDKPETFIQELAIIPDAPILPPISVNFSSFLTSEVIHQKPNLEPIISPTDSSVSSPIEVIAEENNEIPFIPMSPQNKPEAVIQELVAIPEAPVLPSLPISYSPAIITEEIVDSVVIPEELSISKPIDVVVEENVEIPAISLPIHNKSEVVTHDFVTIPEAPILPPISINSTITEEINPEPILESVEVSISKPARIVTEENIEVPSITLPIYKPGAVIVGLVAIPEAPVLPPLSINFLPSIITEEINREPILESVGAPAEVPIFRPAEIIAEENIGTAAIPLPIYKPETVIQELVAIPEGPVLPPLSINFTPSIITEEINREPILESVDVSAELPIFGPAEIIAEENIGTAAIPLPIYKPETVIEELVAIPEGPVLPPLTINYTPSIITEEINREPILESVGAPAEVPIFRPAEIIAEENIGTAAIPLPIYKPETVMQELAAIPEGPVLPPLSINFPPSIITEEIHREPILESVDVPAELPIFRPVEVIAGENIEISREPLPIHDKPQAINQELLTIPHAPVLPSMSSNFRPSISIGEINQGTIFESNVNPEDSTISKPAEVITEETFEIPLPTYTKPEIIQELAVLPEPPKLSPLSVQHLSSDIEVNEIIKPEPIKVPLELSPKPAITQGLFPVPDGPILPPFFIDFHRPVITEEVNKTPSRPSGLLAVFPTSKPTKVVIEENGINSLPIREIFNPIKLSAKFPKLKPIELTAEENVDRLAIPMPINGKHFVVQELVSVPKAQKLPASAIDTSVIKEDVKLGISSRPTQHIARKFIIEDILERRPYSKNIAVIKKNINPTVTSNLYNLRVAPSFQLHRTKPTAARVIKYEVPNINQTSIVPHSKVNMTLQSKSKKENRLAFSTSCARNIVADRIVPYIRRRGQPTKLFKIVSSKTVPNFPV